jgi:hypothetical protein
MITDILPMPFIEHHRESQASWDLDPVRLALDLDVRVTGVLLT